MALSHLTFPAACLVLPGLRPDTVLVLETTGAGYQVDIASLLLECPAE